MRFTLVLTLLIGCTLFGFGAHAQDFRMSDLSTSQEPIAKKALTELARILNSEIHRQTGKEDSFEENDFESAFSRNRTLRVNHLEVIGIKGAIFEGISEFGPYKGLADFTKGDAIAVFIPDNGEQKIKFMDQNMETLKLLNKRAASLDPSIKLHSMKTNYPNPKILGALRESLSQTGSAYLSQKISFSSNEVEKSVLLSETAGDYFLVRGQVSRHSLCIPYISLVKNDEPTDLILVTQDTKNLSAEQWYGLEVINARLEVSGSTTTISPNDISPNCNSPKERRP